MKELDVMEKEKVLANFLNNEDATCVDSYIVGVEDAEECPSYDMSIHSNPDAAAWTKFFREKNPDCNVDDQTMFGWFANAMMAMHDMETLERIASNVVACVTEAGSKERDLLESCLDEFQYYEVPCFELVIKIKELLAQTAQEPDVRESVEGDNK